MNSSAVDLIPNATGNAITALTFFSPNCLLAGTSNGELLAITPVTATVASTSQFVPFAPPQSDLAIVAFAAPPTAAAAATSLVAVQGAGMWLVTCSDPSNVELLPLMPLPVQMAQVRGVQRMPRSGRYVVLGPQSTLLVDTLASRVLACAACHRACRVCRLRRRGLVLSELAGRVAATAACTGTGRKECLCVCPKQRSRVDAGGVRVWCAAGGGRRWRYSEGFSAARPSMVCPAYTLI